MAAIVALKCQEKNGGEDGVEKTDTDALAKEDNRLLGVPKELRKNFLEASRLHLMDKLNHDKFKELELEDVEDLATALGTEPDGSMKLGLIRLFLMTQLADACNDEEADMLLEPFKESEFAKKGQELEDICVPIKALHEALTTGEVLDKFLKDRKIKLALGLEVTRDMFHARVDMVCDRNDALMTLPITVLFMILFCILVTGHLRVYNRQLLEKAVEEYVNGRDPRETADENVDDLESWWEWVQGPGTNGPLGKIKTNIKTGLPYCLLASRNQLIGDVKLEVIKFDGTSMNQWLLKHDEAKKVLTANPDSETRFHDAAVAASNYLAENGWSDPQIEITRLSFMSYNEYGKMFGITEVTIPLYGSGQVVHMINTDAVASDPYPEKVLLGSADILFFTLVAWIFKGEFLDACGALRYGCDEFKDYWEFWNCVDWINIVLSVLCAMSWGMTMVYMRSKCLDALIDDDYKVKVDLTALTEVELNEIWDALVQLRDIYVVMQWLFAFLTMSVVMKFFKAFSSNPRLMVVTNTFKSAMVDLVHFFITFSTIFLPFMIIAHILFGSDLTEFSSVAASINTGIFTVMGEFGWYYDISPRYGYELLPSGMPKMVLAVWWYIFMFLLLLVLLNMLLAIVIEHYTGITGKLKEEIEAPPIWTQVSEYRKFKKHTKSYLPLEEIRARLDNDSDPAHPGGEVTAKSLIEAFQPEMSEEQGEWLYSFLREYYDKAKKVESGNKTQRMEELATENSRKIGMVVEAVSKNKDKIQTMIDKKTDGDAPKVSGDDAKLASIQTSVQSLCTNIGKVRRDQDRLSRRIQTLAGSVPKSGPGGASRGATSPSKGIQPKPDGNDAPTPPEVGDGKSPGSGGSSESNRWRDRKKGKS